MGARCEQIKEFIRHMRVCSGKTCNKWECPLVQRIVNHLKTC